MDQEQDKRRQEVCDKVAELLIYGRVYIVRFFVDQDGLIVKMKWKSRPVDTSEIDLRDEGFPER